MWYYPIVAYAGVLELADETDSKSVVSDGVWVRVPPPAPTKKHFCLPTKVLFLMIFAFGDASLKCHEFCAIIF